MVLAAVLGTCVGAAHMLAMRWLAGKVGNMSGSANGLVMAMMLTRLAPITAAALSLMVWGASAGLGVLSGYWLGRTGVLGATIARRS